MKKKLIQRLQDAKKIAIFGHVSPDGDAVWSSLAMDWILKNMWKESQVFLISKPTAFEFLPWYRSIKTVFDYADYDTIIIVDSSTIDRLDIFYKENPSYFENKEIIVIDHHIAASKGFGIDVDLMLQDSSYSSTCGHIYDLLSEDLRKYFDKDIATNLFFGIYTDTGWFVHENDSERVFDACSKLFEMWADKSLVIDKFVKSKCIWEIRLLWEMINRMKSQEGILYTYYDQDELWNFWVDREISKVWYSTLSKIDWPKALVIAKKDWNKIRFGMRSKWKYDVQKVADALWWWGHKYAAGFSIDLQEGEDYLEIIKDIVKKIRRLI